MLPKCFLTDIMDRNLGAPDVNYHGQSTGTVFYQFGRKDPFASGSLYKPDGSSISISTIAWNSDAITSKSSEKGKNVPYSIQNPLKYITGTEWTTGDQYCPADGGSFLWQDPKSEPSADGKVKKSIFDPCPSGWMVPLKGIWDGFTASNSPWKSNMLEGNGRYYYPVGTKESTIYAYYPSPGYRQGSNASFYYNDMCGFYWCCTPSSNKACNVVFANEGWGGLSLNSATARTTGCNVRCIQEYF